MVVPGDHDIVQILIILQGKQTPLWRASHEGRLDTVEVLLDRDAEVNQRTDVRTLYNIMLLLGSQCTCAGDRQKLLT